MSNFNQDIAEQYRLTIFENEASDREVIDFEVYDSDTDDNVAWAWGGVDDYEVVCTHPNIEYDDDETQGYCPICGKYCDWHREIGDEEGHTRRVPHQWYEGDGGIIKEYIKQFEREKNVCE